MNFKQKLGYGKDMSKYIYNKPMTIEHHVAIFLKYHMDNPRALVFHVNAIGNYAAANEGSIAHAMWALITNNGLGGDDALATNIRDGIAWKVDPKKLKALLTKYGM